MELQNKFFTREKSYLSEHHTGIFYIQNQVAVFEITSKIKSAQYSKERYFHYKTSINITDHVIKKYRTRI